jgi:GNAT superfamily N-acetyltransferase
VRAATPSDGPAIAELARSFWGETEVDCFDRSHDVSGTAAFVTCLGTQVVGALCYALEDDTMIIVLLNVLPDFQGWGAAHDMIHAARREALRRGLRCLIVATTNDDLPALALYQRSGFYITSVVPGRLVQHHGGEESGFGGIPIRDEVRLACDL